MICVWLHSVCVVSVKTHDRETLDEPAELNPAEDNTPSNGMTGTQYYFHYCMMSLVSV